MEFKFSLDAQFKPDKDGICIIDKSTIKQFDFSKVS